MKLHKLLLALCLLPSMLSAQYGLEVEVVSEDIGVLVGALGTTDLTGYSCYRAYITMENEDDFLSSISGDATNPTNVRLLRTTLPRSAGSVPRQTASTACCFRYMPTCHLTAGSPLDLKEFRMQQRAKLLCQRFNRVPTLGRPTLIRDWVPQAPTSLLTTPSEERGTP